MRRDRPRRPASGRPVTVCCGRDAVHVDGAILRVGRGRAQRSVADPQRQRGRLRDESTLHRTAPGASANAARLRGGNRWWSRPARAAGRRPACTCGGRAKDFAVPAALGVGLQVARVSMSCRARMALIVQRAAPPAASSWMPPKPPLLMQTMWSPGRAAASTCATSASMVRRPAARAPIGASAARGVPVQAAAVAEREVGRFQAPGQLRRHGAQLHGVAARLEHRQDALALLAIALELAAQAVERGADGGGVVGEVVVDGDPPPRAHAPRTSMRRRRSEAAQGPRPPRRRHADMLRGGDRGQRIHLVVHAVRPHSTRPTGCAALSTSKASCAPRGAASRRGRAEARQLAPAALRQHARQAVFAAR